MVFFVGVNLLKPPGGSLICAEHLLIVGTGFCPMVRGLPRAMLATDASVEKIEKTTDYSF